MKKINIEDVYYSYIKNGVIDQWRLDLVFKEGSNYECFFTHMDSGQKEVKMLPRSENHKINHMVEAIFCD